jgi:thiamine-monophosphate kinase
VLTVSIFGRSAGIEPLTRSGARAGDLIFVTGPLGGSMLGRHMEFIPRVREARILAETGSLTAMIDLSDGLSRDLANICSASNVGAEVESARIPVHEDAIAMRRDGHSPLEHALHDGEDYELLFTASPNVITAETLNKNARIIGRISAKRGVFIVIDGKSVELVAKGWEHTF